MKKILSSIATTIALSSSLFAVTHIDSNNSKFQTKALKVQKEIRGISKKFFDDFLKKYQDEVELAKKRSENMSKSPLSSEDNKNQMRTQLNFKQQQLDRMKKELVELQRFFIKSQLKDVKKVATILNTKGIEEALKFINSLKIIDIKKNPQTIKLEASEISLLKAKLYILNNNPKLAKKAYKESIEYYENIDGLFQFANFLYKQKDFTEAKKYFDQVLKKLKKPEQRVIVLNNMAILFNAQNQTKDAQKAYNEALVIRADLAKKDPKKYEVDYAHILVMGVYVFNKPTTNLKTAKEILNRHKDIRKAKELLEMIDKFSKKSKS